MCDLLVLRHLKQTLSYKKKLYFPCNLQILVVFYKKFDLTNSDLGLDIQTQTLRALYC